MSEIKPKVSLVGQDGNAFAILGRCREAMSEAGIDKKIYKEFEAKATSGDYSNLLRTVVEYFDVE